MPSEEFHPVKLLETEVYGAVKISRTSSDRKERNKEEAIHYPLQAQARVLRRVSRKYPRTRSPGGYFRTNVPRGLLFG